MQAMTIAQFGDSQVFTQSDIAKPSVKPGQVLVRVAASSVNTVDMMIREMGAELPFAPALPAVLGMDFAGTIEAIADDVTEFAVGDEVYGCAGGLADLPGSLAQYMAADSRLIAKKPPSLSMREAAAIPLVGITAYEGLQRANIQSGQQILVHGGSGGVGHIALQLANYWGGEVYSTGGGEAQLAMIRTLGAPAINYRDETVDDYVQQYTRGLGFDLVFDSVGGANLNNSFQAAKLNGQIATTVALEAIDLTPAHFKGLSLHVVFMLIPMLHNVGREQHGKILTELARIADEGKLKPILDSETFSMQQIGQAHERLASGKALGKVVVSI